MSLKSEFDKWKTENKQHGRQAFSRFIMLKFLDGLQDTSEDFVFKGGNLLWHYIKTPRETIDLDLSTINLKSHLEVKKFIEKSFEIHNEIEFALKEFKELDGVNEIGAAIIISFSTTSGQKNQFIIDIVYALPTDISKIKSTLDGEIRLAASIENIICDKLSASHQFKSGNTRMKDFDDLWRIMNSDISIDSKKLSKLLTARKIVWELESGWISFLEEKWKRHVKSYKDIPKDLEKVFTEINSWLDRLLS
jgi:hypothetical protein